METLYARFGHWLTGVDNEAEVNTFATSAGGTTVNLTVMADGDALKDTSASYRGPAAGMSVEKTTDSDGEITEINSAAFTATVNLKATFGPGESPTLGGTVTDFRGDATDPNWSVELQVRPFERQHCTDGRDSRHRSRWRVDGNRPMARLPIGARRASSAASTPTSRTVMPPGRTPRDSSRCITWDRDLTVRS